MKDNTIHFGLLRGQDESVLTKQYRLHEGGGICKISAPNFACGTAETIGIEKLSDIENIIDNLGTNECISAGVFDSPTCEIVTKGMLDEVCLAAGVRSRTSEHMAQPSPGITLLDHDPGPDMPDHLRCTTPSELMSKLKKAIPAFTFVAYSGAGSCSSGITVTETDELYQGGGGLHVYITVKNVGLKALRRYLVVNLWINGMGYIAFARNGAMLERCIIDTSVLSAERLIYEAEPVLGKGLSRRDREWQHRGGTVFPGNLSLTDDDIAKYEQLVANAKADPENKAKAEALADRHHEARVDALAEYNSISREEAASRIPKQTPTERDSQERTLQPNDIIEIQGKQLSVAELLEHGEEFDNVAMPDPVEGSAYGMTTAMFYRNDGQSPCIHSFAHGLKTVYRFRNRQPRADISDDQDLHPTDTKTGFDIDRAKPLDPGTFPNQKLGKGGEIKLLETIPNVAHLLKAYGITIRYDVIRKEVDIRLPGVSGTSDNYSNVMIEYITSLAKLNGIPAGQIPGYVFVIADRNPINPVATWINRKVWDGINRLPDVYATLVVPEEFPVQLKETLIRRWLLSAVAAALRPSGFRTRGVLVLQGRQLLGKTSWFLSLIPDSLLRDSVILAGHHLDPANKDSLTTAIMHWVVEMGELDSTFRKDVARLKGFLTSDKDKVRRPYAKTNSEYQRRTVFCASVNEETFLVDPTGNSRFWTLPVIRIDYQHGIDMQQVFAQLAVDSDQGAQWWLTPEEETELEVQNDVHRAVSSLEELILPELVFDMSIELWCYKSATEVLQAIGIDRPTNPQCRECGSLLRRHFGSPKKIMGIMKWKVPLKSRFTP